MSPATPSKPSPTVISGGRGALHMHPLALGYRTLGRVARSLPRDAAYAAARGLMEGAYYAWPQGAQAARQNARCLRPHVHWDGTSGDLARAQFRRYGEYLVDAVRLDEVSSADCFEAINGGDQAYASAWSQLRDWHGQGPILFAVMHIGNWDVLGGAFTHAVGPSMVLVDDLGHPELNEAVQGQRARLGMAPATGQRGLRQIVAHLRANGTAAVLFDRPVNRGERLVDATLFSEPCRLPATMGRIAALTDAKVIPLAAVRRGAGFAFQPRLDLEFDAPSDPYEIVRATLSRFEVWLRDDPDQWYQFRRFFTGSVNCRARSDFLR